METHNSQLTPEQDALQHIAACRDKPFLKERFIDSFKGSGVFTRKTIEPSTFVIEYRGKISEIDARSVRIGGDTFHGFLHKFSWHGSRWCVDATRDDGSLGRLVNDDHTSPNCIMKKIICEGKPHLCLFAVKEISPGEEITYNYGSFSYSWRSNMLCFLTSPVYRPAAVPGTYRS
ncbi:histone-lysine N-methyltransferase set-1-like [Salarias fasciatus]|uniref:histone-lysine N-methyltransferase set-1-like n=1 Tax=Salarias fasciatus TaxID=181472 RepID=UPI0011765FB8|nr:histone-lysine N-methyltransferase set-1-like [Salarias fasciatus]